MVCVTAWIVIVLLGGVLLFVSGAKAVEVRQRNDELIRALYDILNMVNEEVLFTDQEKPFTDALDDAMQLCLAYDESNITLTR